MVKKHHVFFEHELALNIAIVEDDVDLLENTLDYLDSCGFTVWGVTSAEAFYKKLLKEPVDVVILDIGLPAEDGFSVAEYLSELPDIVVIIVSARQELDARLKALEAGADRYLLKPVDMQELLINIKAATRGRIFPQTTSISTYWQLRESDWTLISPDNKTITLTSSEYFFLCELIKSNGKVVAKTHLLSHLFPDTNHSNATERLDAQIARLRKKVQLNLLTPLPIKTVIAVGYIFTASAKLI